MPWLRAWEGAGEKTVVLAVETAAQADELAARAEALGLPGALRAALQRYLCALCVLQRLSSNSCCVVCTLFAAVHAVLDAGRTEVAPGSFTVLAIGGAMTQSRLHSLAVC